MPIDFHALAEKYGTPLYVYDFDQMRENYRRLKEAFAGSKSLIAYAVKANSNLSVISLFGKLGAGADCVSLGEILRARTAGIEPYRIIFSGVGKRDDEIEAALKEGILMINLESEAEMHRVEEVAQRLGQEARISIRVNPNVDPQTHPYISTGLHENKFGVEIDRAKRMYIYAKNSDWLDPVGIHFHIGSQLTELEPIKEAASIVADLVRSLAAIGIEIRFFDVGGGLGVVYRDETPIDVEEYAKVITESIKGLDLTIICEPGRYLTANAGWLLTRVLYEKNNGAKRFVIVDAAMNDLMRPTLYQAYHGVEYLEPDAKERGEATPADLVGPICESGDWLAKERLLPPTRSGDLLAIRSAGAYGFTMASNYNTRGRPAEVACEQGQCRLIRDRENFEDQIRLEKGHLEA
ncbi:diaminopimelate decarboxylase [Nitratifractor salsuginis]|uniref:Diaminopimelate decarboxylase n=1 Tax=Nitratifractor salsuginis (strain DSM 16511 / JCM 12458 / E9I37-1) TaxID=749222 RepID=E6WZI4_NITSE|nr:diaminopimelate decarboxylase [Nitratifractor salsuginis]ADV45564.1 diaminopimelate decarboxylase [Nitratifractor salsuginis DSM 16511]